LRTAQTAIVAALVVAGSVWAAWPPPAREGVRFTPPESIELEFPDGGMLANVVSTAGRVIANKSVALVFRWLVEPVSIEVTEPRGAFELRLGPPGTGAWLRSDGQTLQLDAEGGVAQSLPAPGGPPSRVALVYEQGAYRARLDGHDAGEPLVLPAPPGPGALLLELGASMSGLDCETRDGISRHVGGEPPPPRWTRTAWAALASIVGLLCLGGWWSFIVGRRVGTAARTAALLSSAVLVLGLPLEFLARNEARLAAPDPCETEQLEQSEPRAVEPGAPWDLGGRTDADFRLAAQVLLREGSALDVLVRAGLPSIDRQLFATLSTDPRLPSGVGRNLGTVLESQPADAELARLPSGRPLRLEIECRDDRMEARIDGRPLGAVRDLDLRSGRTAFQALAGSAWISDLRLEPLGQPTSLSGLLTGRALAAGAVALATLLLLAFPCKLRWGALLWAWPLAAVVPPMASDAGTWFAACAAALLALPIAGRAAAQGRPLAALLACLVALELAGASIWSLMERPAEISPAILNALRDCDIAGEPVPAAYAWARHPLCRRFNPYMRGQQFRGRSYPARKPPGLLRVLALGSSSTFGYGVSGRDAWAARLEGLLNQGGSRVEVINAGVPGGTAERLRFFLEGVLLPLHPDVVIVDLSFNDRSIGGVADEREHFRTMTTTGIGPLGRLVARWLTARRDVACARYFRDADRGDPVSDADRERFSLGPARRFQDSLRDMAASCRSAGAAIVFVQEPQRAGDEPTIADFHDAIAELGRELGAPVVAPQAALDSSGAPVFLDAVHPTPEGHAIIAQAIAAVLAEAGLTGR